MTMLDLTHVDRSERTDRQHVEAAARTRKAHRIASVLRQHNATSCDAVRLDEAGQLAAAELAGVRPASSTTWSCVVALLELWESGR